MTYREFTVSLLGFGFAVCLEFPINIKVFGFAVCFTMAKTEIIYPKNVGASVAMNFTKNELWASMAIEKIKILGALLELPAKPIQPTYLKIGPNWPNRTY